MIYSDANAHKHGKTESWYINHNRIHTYQDQHHDMIASDTVIANNLLEPLARHSLENEFRSRMRNYFESSLVSLAEHSCERDCEGIICFDKVGLCGLDNHAILPLKEVAPSSDAKYPHNMEFQRMF